MKLEKAHINKIRTEFAEMQTKEDLLKVLNEAKSLVYGDNAVPFELKQLTWYANPKNGGKRYKEFRIKKKSGSDRIIHAPINGLKSLQKTLSFVLQCVFEPHKAAMGFVRDRSIVDNAKLHVGSRYVYNIDLKDFFHSIDQARVWKCLQLKPFNLKLHSNLVLQNNVEKNTKKATKYLDKVDAKLAKTNTITLFDDYIIDENRRLVKKRKDSNRLDIANIIASLCCAEMEVERQTETGEWENVNRNVLPQGAPSSPVITNIVCQKLDYLLTGVAKRFGLKYSRYADDITFSSLHNVYKPESEFINEINRIILEQNFHIKESKTRLQKDGYRKEVTGLLVNEKVNVQKRYIKQLRMWLYYWERYGYKKAKSYFLQQYIADKGHIMNGKPDMAKIISGKLDYLKMVKGADNELYLKLKERFKTLNKEINSNNINTKSKIQNKTVNPQKQPSIKYPIKHEPRYTVELLKYFTANDKDLKYSTHSWEEGRYNSYEDYISKIKFEWKQISEKLENQSVRLHAKISNFLFNKELGQKNIKGYYNAWGEKLLKFGWSSKELKTHMSVQGNSPFSCPIPEHIRLLDKKHDFIYFKQYADVFKNEIEFREDSNNFKKMILDLWELELSYDFDIEGINNLIGFSFFSDVINVKNTIRILFRDLFKTKPEFNKITIEKHSNFKNGGYHLFKITQKNSFVTREINDPKLTNPTGNLYSIIKNLKNLADYSIISKFADGKIYRITYLSSDKVNHIEDVTKKENVYGFTHEFKFYL